MAFEAIEHIGYNKVAIRAWLRRNKYDGELKDRLFSLATGERAPIRGSGKKLIFYSSIYPPVYDFLHNPVNQRAIKQALLASGIQS